MSKKETILIKLTDRSMNLNKVQIYLGLSVLSMGFMIYALRPTSLFLIVENSFFGLQIITGSLPDFVHPIGFILLTIGLLGIENKFFQGIVCFAWLILESFFEFGQLFAVQYAQAIPSWFNKTPILRQAEGFFLNGTFDVNDVIAIVLGSITAFLLSLITVRRKK